MEVNNSSSSSDCFLLILIVALKNVKEVLIFKYADDVESSDSWLVTQTAFQRVGWETFVRYRWRKQISVIV